MSTGQNHELREIRSFPTLVKYLRDKLDWPVESDDFDDLTFDYDAEDLGIDTKTAAKIQEIKQLRPLITNQPWGIFFVKFEPKRLPVIALRRILGRLVIKKRASANKSEMASWQLNDLLFISSYGEGDTRQIGLAHFSHDEHIGDLPTLRVLGWDGDDRDLKLDHVAHELQSKLCWPADEEDPSAWRDQWSSAFTLRHREVITTSQQLAICLADLARSIRRKVNAALAVESQDGPLRKLMQGFQEALIHDLQDDDFADMYAQTIAYGLLSARVSSQSGAIVADDIALIVPVTNPFLRELMETFIKVGGRNRSGTAGIDFDELGINDVVELLREANMDAVLRDFDNRNPQEDPVIHFYELFLKEYDAKKRMQRGVFYTPKPVVNYIVRSVHEQLQTEFGLKHGLADATTWGEICRRDPEFRIPDGAKPNHPFVQILDPATGTATFLVEVIDVIYRHLKGTWDEEGESEMPGRLLTHGRGFDEYWNQYVPKYLLPRVHGYELMMAPYTIAHMKIGLKLAETGYRFQSAERVQVFLTNSLEEPKDVSGYFEQMVPALAHEAEAASKAKSSLLPTVVIANPPYSGRSWNLSPELRKTVEAYRFVGGNRIREKGALQLEKSIQEDYIKFIRFAQVMVERAGVGIVGFITSHGFLDNPTLRGMRCSLIESFCDLRFLDLHGNVSRGETCPDGSVDENVFDIRKTGAAISMLIRSNRDQQPVVSISDLWGSRDTVKYPWLMSNSLATAQFRQIQPMAPSFLFVFQDLQQKEEYDRGYSIAQILPLHSKGVVTGRDAFVSDFDEPPLLERMRDFVDASQSDEDLIERYDLNPTAWWSVQKARKKMPAPRKHRQYLRTMLYRPFDFRVCFYHASVFMSPRRPVMQHFPPNKPNLLLVTSRMTKGEAFAHVTVAKGLAEAILLSSKTSNNAIIFPVYLYRDTDAQRPTLNLGAERKSAFADRFLAEACRLLRVDLQSVGSGDLKTTAGPDDFLHFILSILHSPSYRERYQEFLKRDFPRVPLTDSIELFRALAQLGGELLSLHLMESAKLAKLLTTYVGSGKPQVEKVSYSKKTVWLDKAKTRGFRGVPENVWRFHLGGYQVCEKWLKDRGPKKGQPGRVLSKDDINHYHRIVVALHETLRLMTEIDEVINRHGGWPDAFVTDHIETSEEEPASPFA